MVFIFLLIKFAMNFLLEISLYGIYVVRGGGFTDGVKQHVGRTQEPSPRGGCNHSLWEESTFHIYLTL